MHRAIVSLQEELEAADWYNQRIDACKDKELKPSSRITATRKKNTPPCLWNGCAAKTRRLRDT